MTPPGTERSSERAPATSAGRPSRPPERNDARARVRQLRAEAEATSERVGRALLLYEAGYLNEVLLHQPAQAVQDYLAAYNTDARSRLPLHALVRMFERRRSYKNLARLYDAEQRSARSPSEVAAALTDQAVLGLLVGEPPAQMSALLEQALEHEPSGAAALLLEWRRRAEGDREGARRALHRRASRCDDNEPRAALLLELARGYEETGELERALAALRTAALGPEPVSEPYAMALARFARQHALTRELVEASERRAQALRAELTRSEGDPGADPELQAQLRARALGHWYEAARLRCARLGDPAGALPSLDAAIVLAPHDLALRHLRMLAYDLLEDRGRAAAEARVLLDAGLDGRQAAALHFRLAEDFLVAGDAENARKTLIQTIFVAGESAAAEAILDDLLLDEQRHDERIAQREALSAQSRAPRALRALGEAAQIAAQEQRDSERTRALYTRAEAVSPGDPQLLREAYGSALDLDDEALARFAIERLLKLDLELDERAALLHHRFELADDAERRGLLGEHAGDAPAAHVLKLAVGHAATLRDYVSLGRAHEALARVASDADEATAELCAGARAFLRGGDAQTARTLLEQALERTPSQRYALTLLEEVMRDQGDAEGAISLLRRAAQQHEGERGAELHLLAAGAAAELANQPERAAESYMEAASSHGSRSALWALYRLGQRRGDVDLERKAREELAARERAEGRFGVDTLLLAEHYDLVDHDPSRAAALLRATLDDIDVGHHAAISVVISRSVPSELRERALELLATRATDSLRPALLRELGGELVAQGGSAQHALDLAERVRMVRPDDRWAAFARTHAALAQGIESHAAALKELAEVTSDTAVADCARAEALWTHQLSAPERPIDEALSQVLPAGGELGLELADAILQLASPAHDGALRREAIDTLARGSDPSERPRLLLAQARARFAENDASGALTCLEELLARHPERLDAWELAHAAARTFNHAKLRADAAQILGEHLDGEEALGLLEESARVRMDELDDAAGAATLLERLLATEPLHERAYARLHELRTRADDTEALIALVRTRAQQVDEPETLVRLYVELARLERRRGGWEAAADAIDHVLMLDDEHVGALALSAEIHTTQGSFREAVAALDRLVDASALPSVQRRLAGLAAADFLEHKLDDPEAAQARLEGLIALEPELSELHLRMADLAERRSDFERAGQALERVVALTTDGPRCTAALRYAGLLAQQLNRASEAASWYRRVLTWAPDQLDAARALLKIEHDPVLVRKLEDELRARAQDAPSAPEPLRALYELSALKEDRDLAYVALSALSALRQLDPDERRAYQQERARAIGSEMLPGATLSDADLRALLAPHLNGAVEQLLGAVFELGPALDQFEPARFGVGRSQRVGPRDPHPVRDQLAALVEALGVTLGDVYEGGSEPASVYALPRNGTLGFVIGARVDAPLAGAVRYATALQIAGFRLTTLPLVGRTPAEGAELLYAALLAGDCPLPPGVDPDALEPLRRSVAKVMPRKTKRALPELLRALPDGGAGLELHCSVALARTRRLALLLAGELEPALREAGETGDDDSVRDLLRTWISGALAASRRKLGLAP